MIHVKRNGGTERGMYGLIIPVHATSGNPVTIRNDIDLCERLRIEGVDEATINDALAHLQHKDDYATLEGSAGGGWAVVEFGNKKTG
jgi:hypothetical protein